jgi:hypothetical protein
MLLKYNDGYTTHILQTKESLDLDQVDYITDINKGDEYTVAYLLDGETMIKLYVIASEESTEEPHLKEL